MTGGMTMKTGKYGAGIKLTAVIVEIILMVICTVCLGMAFCNAVITVPGRNGLQGYYINPFSQKTDFKESEIFQAMVRDNLESIVRYCVIRGQLETDGVFDEMKEVDIEQYARHFEEMPVSDTSITYRLGDLIKWGQSRDGVSVEEYPRSEVEEMIRKAHREVAGEENAAEEIEWSEAVTEDMEATELAIGRAGEAEEYVGIVTEQNAEATVAVEEEEYISVPEEYYLPADGRSMLAHVESVEELAEMTFYLKETVQLLADNYVAYKEYREYYDEEKSNLKYCIRLEREKGTEIYTNIESDALDIRKINDYFITATGKSLCFAPAYFTYESNIPIGEREVRDIWNQYRYAYPDDTTVWLGVDTAFVYRDAFYNAKESYTRTMPGYFFIIIGGISGLLSLLLLGFMTYMSGWKKGKEGIVLNWLDRLHTEIWLMAGAVVSSSLIVMTGLAASELYIVTPENTEQVLFIVAVGTMFVGSSFLFFWFGIVRRIKAKVFWKHFLIYRLFLKAKYLLMKIYDDSRLIVRVWVPYLLFVGINLFFIGLDNPIGPEGGTLIAVVLDLLIGLFIYRNSKVQRGILEGIKNIRGGDLDYQINVEKMHGDNRILAEAVNSIGNGIRSAVETSMKDERTKADLITNVSHDIKTPLTSIINYVDLIKREPVENEKIKGYLEILDNKSQRLKQLTEDLVEASKISSGNIVLQCGRLDLAELINQAIGEFMEKFQERDLQLIVNIEQGQLFIYADSRYLWRVVENLFNNVYKYALEHTRIYVEAKKIKEEKGPGRVRLSIKNISAQPLNIDAEDLTERFIRGDVARTTEGSGLGLSIAKNLTELQKGKFEIMSDGDLFKVVIVFSLVV